MITVSEADKIIFSEIKEIPAARIPLEDAYGCALREDIVADRDLPPFNRATMDGIAISLDGYKGGQREFAIEGIQKAGEKSLALSDSKGCLEIMTGAILPEGCNCVIPIENINIDGKKAVLNQDNGLKPMENVHPMGSDHKKGNVLVQKGTRLLPAHIAVAASSGYDQVLVNRSPKIAIIGTGDELVGIDRTPLPFQIRQSNSYALLSACFLHRFNQAKRFHMKDDEGLMKRQLQDLLGDYNAIVLSGGVSMGKFDFVPKVLDSLGVSVLFHKVRQRPGKPFWFGRNKDGKPVFALPGNPVSTQVGFYRYVLPYLNKAIGLNEPSEECASLMEEVNISNEFTNFLPVSLRPEKERLMARPIIPNSSGDFACLAHSDGFVELPPARHHPKYTAARLIRW